MEIRSLMENGVSASEISRMLGVDRKTVKKYAHLEAHPASMVGLKTPPSKLEPYKEYIKVRLEKYPLSAVRILEEIQKQGYRGQISILKDHMASLRHEKTYHAVMPFETTPGQQAQIDWGEFGLIEVEEEVCKLHGFIMVLGYSRVPYLEFTTSMDAHTLIRCHIRAYRYFGGAPKEGLYDNMKQVVLKRCKTVAESKLNPLFADFMAYYGTAINLCRVRKPRTKGKVERMVQYAKDSFFLGREFTDLDDLNAQARAWMDQVNGRVHGTTKETPAARLLKEQPLLIQISERPDYRISEVLYRKARSNCMVSVYSGQYSIPPKFANHEVEVRVEDTELAIFCRGVEIARHKMVPKGGQSFIDAHKRELEEGCFYFPKPKQIGPRRTTQQVEARQQEVEVRNLHSYEEG